VSHDHYEYAGIDYLCPYAKVSKEAGLLYEKTQKVLKELASKPLSTD
jgi:hypothetical protein